MAWIAADLDVIARSEFATFQKLDGNGPAAVGDEYIVRMPHLEAGQIEFRVRREHCGLEFTIESWARSGDRLSDCCTRTCGWPRRSRCICGPRCSSAS